MNTKAVQAVMAETQAGQLTFPDVVRRLLDAGVESYFVDFATGSETLYGSDGQTHVASLALARGPIAEEFSAPGIVAAIRAAQADTLRYPEFVQRSTAAGVIAYWAFLTGKRVLYFGRKGEMHLEEFPGNIIGTLPHGSGGR
jgi:uncharacterized protein YbcV (DUF1398 family)